jgi:hypothetical protein
MIRAPHAPTSPREALAHALDGTLLGRDAILVGDVVVWASVAGVVRAGGVPIGSWEDPTSVLAAAFRAVA